MLPPACLLLKPKPQDLGTKPPNHLGTKPSSLLLARVQGKPGSVNRQLLVLCLRQLENLATLDERTSVVRVRREATA